MNLMRRAAWRKLGKLLVSASDRRLNVEDKKMVCALAEKLYGAVFPTVNRDTDDLPRRTWREQGVLMVIPSDSRLTWPEKELVKQLGEKLYGQMMEAQ
jgi:hypothetical protein